MLHAGGEHILKRWIVLCLVAMLVPWCHSMTSEGTNSEDNGSFLEKAGAFNGYTLFNLAMGKTTYLIDMSGNAVHTWSLDKGYTPYLLENGNLYRPSEDPSPQINGAAATGIIKEIDWNGNVVWQYEYSSSTYRMHHDIEPMPNGNVLLIAWEIKTAAETSAAGRSDGKELWPDHIVEVEPTGPNTGDIVWEWHIWDHLIQDVDPSKPNYGVVADHPELFDINLGMLGPGGGDWQHMNAVSYNPDLDQITMSSHTMSEIYVIDHSTTTAEAAGHTGGLRGKGGDFLYRWGNAANYDTPGNYVCDVVHASWWVPKGLPGEGNILLFDNDDSAGASTICELELPLDSTDNYTRPPSAPFGPSQPNWTYAASGFFSNHLGSNQRLPNGNTFIAESTSGYLFEVTSTGQKVWEYQHPGSPLPQIPAAWRYAPDYPGLKRLWPLCKITSPTEGATVSGVVNVQGTASANIGTIQKVEVKIDSGSWADATGTTSWTYNWDTTSVPDGLHTISALL